jgi:opacity protein-like surface antigen
MKKNLLIIAALITLIMPAICSATPPRPGPYVSGFAGISVPRDTNVTTSSFPDTFNDRVEFDPGAYVGGTGGFDFGYLRLEGELSYRYSEIEAITDKNAGFQFRNVDGNLGAFAMMANAYFDLHNASPVTPYLGGGIGMAILHLSDTFGVDPQGGGDFLYAEEDDAVFAYQVGAGLEIALNPILSLDVGYRYFGTSEARFESGFTGTTDLKFESHNAMVGVRVKF